MVVYCIHNISVLAQSKASEKQVTPGEKLLQVPTVYERSDTEDDSERTITLSSPSQKLFLSSQETLSQDTDNVYESLSTGGLSTGVRDNLGETQLEGEYVTGINDKDDSEVVTVTKQVFDDLVRKASTECDLQSQVSKIKRTNVLKGMVKRVHR